ncbi:MAG: hypothetical protein NVS9B10_03530 [Nevskia sp.]
MRRWLESEGSARLQHWGEDEAAKDWVTVKRAGFRCADNFGDDAETYYLLPETFEQEICAGFDARQVAQLLASVGALKRPPVGKDGKARLKCKTRLPSLGPTWCYVVLPSIWQAVPGSASEADKPRDDVP